MALKATGPDATLKSTHGVKGASKLHSILGLDLTEVVAIDSMHAYCYGVCRKVRVVDISSILINIMIQQISFIFSDCGMPL